MEEKFFPMFKRKLLERHKYLIDRKVSTAENFNRTKTFFNFSYKKYRSHFGFYIPCQFNGCDNLVPLLWPANIVDMTSADVT